MHEPVVPVAVNEQVTAEPDAGVAVRVTTVPDSIDVMVKVGVSSAVLLSVLLVPRSEAASRSGVPGVAGLIEMVLVDAAERLPAESAL